MTARMASMALALLASVAGCTKQPTFEEAEQLHKKKDYPAAAAAYTPYAEKGDYRAQVYLGRHYLQKNSKDVTKAAGYFKQAADQGDIDAMYFLGMAYLDGEGVPQNPDIGEQYLAKSARGGSAASALRLCFIQKEKARITWQSSDFIRALQLCENAYKAGKSGAATDISDIYDRGPLRDFTMSTAWTAAGQIADNNLEESVFDMIPSEQKIYVKARAYALYSEFGKNKPSKTYLESLR